MFDQMQNTESPIAIVDVLVVDDDESIRHVVKAALLNAGYAVEASAARGAAIDLLRCLKVRLIVSSLFSPDSEKTEVLVAIKAHGVPVVAISDVVRFTREEEEAFARQFGSVRVLTKPFHLQLLVATARDLIGGPIGAG